MAGKAINNSARGVLILIIPIALVMVFLFTAWPVLLALIVVGAVWNLWQRYQWIQLSQQINPIFHQLIQANQGTITALDLAIKANISGVVAKQYLDIKAEEFAAQQRDFEDKGTVYYFITVSILDSLFSDQEPDTNQPQEFLQPQTVVQVSSLTLTEDVQATPETFSQPEVAILETVESKPELQPQPEPAILETVESKPELQPQPEPAILETVESKLDSLPQQEPLVSPEEEEQEEPPLSTEQKQPTEPPPKKHPIFQSLIQSELARRLDVHSSTVYKRRDYPDFAEWSRSRDPEGIAWDYSEDTREFYPVEETEPPKKT